MKSIFVAIILGLMLISPFHLGNSYLRCSDFESVVIHQGDTLETIASRYTVNAADAKELVEAICEINDIKDATTIKAGRRIDVPVIRNQPEGPQMARR